MNKMTTCLWFDVGKALEAAEFYASVSLTVTSAKETRRPRIEAARRGTTAGK